MEKKLIPYEANQILSELLTHLAGYHSRFLESRYSSLLTPSKFLLSLSFHDITLGLFY